MTNPLNLGEILPKDSKLDKLLSTCANGHALHVHELHDGALSMVCFTCPFHHVLDAKEETVIRAQMELQYPNQ